MDTDPRHHGGALIKIVRIAAALIPAALLTAALGATCLSCSSPETTPPDRGDIDASAPDRDHEVYVAALEALADRLGGAPPSPDATARVLREGRPAYEALVDAALDPAQNPALIPSLWAWLRRYFGSDGRVLRANHPRTGEPLTIHHDDPANLAAWIIAQDRPWTEILTSDQCVRERLDSSGALIGLDPDPCPLDGGVAAGALTQPGFLHLHGQVTSFQRVAAIHLIFSCALYPDASDPGFVRCNHCGQDPAAIPPADDPSGPSLRMLARYKEDECFSCHTTLSPRRMVLVKYDEHGFYDPRRTIRDVEDPRNTLGHCVVVPLDVTPEALTPCCNPEGECLSVREALAQPGGCCFNPMLTDTHAAESSAEVDLGCLSPDSPWCQGFYHGHPMSTPADWARLMLDPEVDGDAFATCAATWWTRFAQGDGVGLLGRGGPPEVAPTPLDPLDAERLRSAFAQTRWSVLRFLGLVFKDELFLRQFDRAPPNPER